MKKIYFIFLLFLFCVFLLTGCNKNEEYKPVIIYYDETLDYSHWRVDDMLQEEMILHFTYDSLEYTSCDLTCESSFNVEDAINNNLKNNKLKMMENLEIEILGRQITLMGTKIGDFANSLKNTYAIARNYNGEHLVPPYTKVTLFFEFNDYEKAWYKGNPLDLYVSGFNNSSEYVTINDLVISGIKIKGLCTDNGDLRDWCCSTTLPYGIQIFEETNDFYIEAKNVISMFDDWYIIIDVLPKNSKEVYDYIKPIGTNLVPQSMPEEFKDKEFFFNNVLFKMWDITFSDVYNYYVTSENDLPKVYPEYIINCNINMKEASAYLFNAKIPLDNFRNFTFGVWNTIDLTKGPTTLNDLLKEEVSYYEIDLGEKDIFKSKYIDNSLTYNELYEKLLEQGLAESYFDEIRTGDYFNVDIREDLGVWVRYNYYIYGSNNLNNKGFIDISKIKITK